MTIDKKVSIALLAAIMLESAGGLLWAGATIERIAALERQAEEVRPVGERLARVETQLEAMRAQLDRIESKVEKL